MADRDGRNTYSKDMKQGANRKQTGNPTGRVKVEQGHTSGLHKGKNRGHTQ